MKRVFVALVGALKGDDDDDVAYVAKRIRTLRVFPDEDGKMNRSLADTGGEVLLVSQFTLAADTGKGRRPSFVQAMEPEQLLKTWLPAGLQGWEQLQKAFWTQMASAKGQKPEGKQ